MNRQEEAIVDYFSTLKQNGRLGPAYLFLGDNTPLLTTAVKICGCAQPNYCDKCWDCRQFDAGTHPDLMVVEAQGVFIKIEQVREAIKFLSMKSYCAPRKVLVVKAAQNLNIAAANAFLKTLEEPPANSVIFIAAPSPEGMLPTIISRCRRIFLPPGEREDFFLKPEMVRNFLAGERIKFNDRKHFLKFLQAWAALLRDKIAGSLGVNNRLLAPAPYEIILPSWDMETTSRILEKTLVIQGVYNSVNENLALNLIRMEML